MVDNNTIQFIMRHRLSRKNLLSNTKTCYLFLERKNGAKGVRFYLAMTDEEQIEEKINALSRRPGKAEDDGDERFLVSFNIEKALSLIGGKEIELL